MSREIRSFQFGVHLYLNWKIPQEHFKHKKNIGVFFYVGFFDKHSRIKGLQGKGEGISLTPHYHFHSLHSHLDISRAIIAEISPLRIASSQTGTGSLWFPSASRYNHSKLRALKPHRLLFPCYIPADTKTSQRSRKNVLILVSKAS